MEKDSKFPNDFRISEADFDYLWYGAVDTWPKNMQLEFYRAIFAESTGLDYDGDRRAFVAYQAMRHSLGFIDIEELFRFMGDEG